MSLFKSLSKICRCKQNQNLKGYCSIKIGGVARFVCFPNSIQSLKKLLLFLNKRKIKYFILGNGTNVVFEDNGYSGVVVCLKKLNKVKIKNIIVTAYAGASLFYVNSLCQQNGLGGLEFSYGIPGTIGGACAMNAGAFGKDISQVIEKVLVLCNGKVKWLKKEQLQFSYRNSRIKKQNMIVLKARFKLSFNGKEQIALIMQNIMQTRLNLQPYDKPSVGSIFKKAKNESAGKYIDKVGLKGVTIGGIQISPKHANFFVNNGEASSNDLHRAMKLATTKVKEEFGVNLEPEIIFVGE